MVYGVIASGANCLFNKSGCNLYEDREERSARGRQNISDTVLTCSIIGSMFTSVCNIVSFPLVVIYMCVHVCLCVCAHVCDMTGYAISILV